MGSDAMILPLCFRRDGEYRQLLMDLTAAFRDRTLPFAASGLCDAAADALMLSLLDDLRGVQKGAALCLLSEEKECVRLQRYFEQYGLRVAFFTARTSLFITLQLPTSTSTSACACYRDCRAATLI